MNAGSPARDRPDRPAVGGPSAGICWVDLGTSDPGATAEFYRRLLGWRIGPPDATGYRLAFRHDRPVAAFGPAEEPGAPYWTVYAGTPDAAATTQAAVTAGATVLVPPTPAGDAGVAATLRAPSGLHLALWQPGSHAGTVTSGRHGTLAQVDLHSPDLTRDSDFLRATLGWSSHPDGTITCAGRPVATWTRPVAEAGGRGRPAWLVRFAADDPTAVGRHAAALGALPRGTPPRTWTDPAGAVFGLARIVDP